ncbi:hypothetical protein C2I18_04295 [Paenibacillus sp. PK3_47]|uniref:hypothetical protein n=1 Tax=Paenibacillus sp. PK3_47 TaxID=2072642 RepID=UPI00201E5EC1|nr:hypothetical protein [Paenibacillus sp. PK3_47]UQZ32847.1 hypothetical protein C2I18_04295 [Paenibacillus sp. PK3_47]
MSDHDKIQELERRINELEYREKHKRDNDPWRSIRGVIWGILIVFFVLIAIGVAQFVSAG